MALSSLSSSSSSFSFSSARSVRLGRALVATVFAALALSAVGCTNETTGTNGTNAGGVKEGATRDENGDTGGNGGDGTGDVTQGGTGGTGGTSQTGAYVQVDSQSEQQQIGNQLWALLTSAPCWYMEGTSTNYSFYGSYQYTYAGLSADRSGGTIGVMSIGRYDAKPAAVVQMSYDTWLLVGIDAQTFTLGKYLNGQPYIEVYRANLGPGICA